MEKIRFNKVISNRMDYLDIAKGIGIIMVVWAHSQGPFTSYIGQFHMPLFFLISGFLFNNSGSFKSFLIKKMQTLYIPFIGWNILFTIFQIIKADDIKLHAQYGRRILEIVLTLNKNDFFGATWFLGALFLISILYKLLYSQLEESKYKIYYITSFFIVLAIVAFEITLPYMMSRTLVLGMFYALGYLIKSNIKTIMQLDKLVVVITSLIIFVIIAYHNTVNLGANKYTYRLLFVVGAIFAIYVTIYISKIISKWDIGLLKYIKRICCYLGINSIDILIWHLLIFRFVVGIQLYIENISLKHIWKYYPVYNVNNGWWLIYTLAGIIISLVLGRILKFGVWGKILKKVHFIQ